MDIQVAQEHKDIILDWYENDPTRVLIVSGAAGCGKTTLIRKIPSILNLRGKIAFLAPTGKAAKVIGSHGRTIHSFMYIPVVDTNTGQVKEWIPRVAEEFEDYDLLIVDEVSMVNDEMMNDLKSLGIPIIGSGDPFQLPPVNGTNEILQDADIMLLKVWRNDGGVLALATDIRKRNRIKWSTYDNVSINFLGIGKDYDKIDENSIIICKFNNTRKQINHEYRKKILGHKLILEPGEKLMITKNNKISGLRNGSIVTLLKTVTVNKKYLTGIIEVEDDEGLKYQIEMNFDQVMLREERTFKNPKMHYMDYAYAITCHKAQGSEYDKVFIINEGKNFGDHRAWYYTAVTRAKKKVYVYN